MSQANVIDREDDGISHLNIWSKARTELGQTLSNFAHTPFTHPVHGAFASVEALWYWAGTGKTHQELRRMYGVSAKSYGKRLETVELPVEEFRTIITEGLRCKLEQHHKLREAFINCTLPFEHYFVFGRNNEVIVDQRKKHGWQTDYLEKLRDEWRAERDLPPAAEAQSTNPKPILKKIKDPPPEGWQDDPNGL